MALCPKVFFTFKRLHRRNLRECIFKRTYAVKRRKPIDPSEEDQLPVFEYDMGSSTSRRMYVWGLAEHGALGIQMKLHKGRLPPEYYQRPSCHTFSFIRKIKDVGCGFGFTVIVVDSNDEHKLFGCGINMDSQIGYHAPRRDHPLGLVLAPAPIHIPFKSNKTKVLKVAAGRAHTAVLSDEEGVFTLGNNAYGQCGRQIVEDENYEGSQIVNNIPNLDGESISDICCGQDHTLLLTRSGKVWSCGWGADGQTGLGHYRTEWRPSLVKGDIEKECIVKLSSVGDCVLALNDKGQIFGWGNSEYKQLLQDNSEMQYNLPVYLSKLKHVGRIIDVSAGGSNCIIVNDDGLVYVWGFGMLGSGPDVVRCNEPIQLPPTLFGYNQFNTDVKVTNVFSGLYHFGAITNNGHLYMWGRNKGGCLGLGHTKDQYFPIKVAVGAHVIKVSPGVDHTVALCKPFA